MRLWCHTRSEGLAARSSVKYSPQSDILLGFIEGCLYDTTIRSTCEKSKQNEIYVEAMYLCQGEIDADVEERKE